MKFGVGTNSVLFFPLPKSVSEVEGIGGFGPVLVKLVNDELAIMLLGALTSARKSVIRFCLVSSFTLS